MNLLEIFERIMGRNDLRGKHAVITGAASGIGRALALNLANEGCRLALADIDSDGLNETAEEAREYGIYVSTHMVDVSDLEQVKLFVNAVIKKHAVVDIVINNAGITIFETLEDVTYEDFERIIDINLWGVIYGCKEFIPYLKKQRSANIVNICSVNGIFTNPNNGPYCTSKFAVRGFTETLIQELSDTNIKVSCVFPGAIKTNIINNAKFYKASKNLPKEKIAKKI